MTTLRIYDNHNGVLALDLRDLIDLLAPRSIEASWTASPVKLGNPELGRSIDEFMMTGPGRPGGDQLEFLAASGSPVSGLMFCGVRPRNMAGDLGRVRGDSSRTA